jgi:hypothetical protein
MSEKNQNEKNEKNEKIDKMLEVLSIPISSHILALLTGVNPGKFEGKITSKTSKSGKFKQQKRTKDKPNNQ